MRRFLFARVILLSLGVVAVLSAQQPAGPPQPTSPSQAPTPGAPSPLPPRAGRPATGPAKGTAILRGYVVAADTGSPVRRAMVRVFAATGGGSSTTSTDAEGRWELKNLPAGAYTISVSKAGFAPASYGQRTADQTGRPLEVLDGQLVEKIGFSLIRGGVITGRITDEFGEPVAGAQVSALRYRYVAGGRRLFPTGTATTDDLGAFRIYGLVPGEYHVMGTLRSMMMMNMPGSRTTDVEGYAPTYYPGTTSPAQSQRLVVRASQETTNVSFALSATMLTTISGRVLSSTSEPIVQANVRVTPADRNEASTMMMFNTAITAADGSFEVSGMTPGNYVLQVFPRNFDGRPTEFGRQRVTVGNDNLENVVVVMSRGAVMNGSITTDEGTPLPIAPQLVNVFVRPVEPEIMPMAGPPKVNDDWTFEVANLNDRSIISAAVAGAPDWVVKAVYHNGLDITDTPTDFAPGLTLEGVQIVFTRKISVVSGTITDARGKPDLDATVVAFAQDSRRWTPMTRFSRTARPNQDGRYTLRGLPPEDYFVAVVKEIEPGRLADPEYLDSLRDQAVRITLGEAETKALDLKSPPPR